MSGLLDRLQQCNYILEMLAACLLFALPLKKRHRPWLRFGAGALAALVVSMTVGGVSSTGVAEAGIAYLAQLIVVVLPIWLSCDVSVEDAVYGTICAYAMQHFSSSLYILLCLGTGAGHDIWQLLDPATLGYYLLAYVPPYFLIYRLCARPLGRGGSYRASLFRAGGITVLVLPVALFLSLAAKLSGGGGGAFLVCQVYAMLCSAYVLWVQVSQSREVQLQAELKVQQALWEKEKEQYQLSRATIEVINRKCHDLKHQLAALRHCSEPQREESLREIEQAALIYDAVVQTGNEVLDTVLTEKSLVCEHRNIQWTCMADGRGLAGMNPVDLYALVGNALDNAIESVQQLQDPAKRVIGVTLFRRDGLSVLRVENYCETPPLFRDGLPVTTKQDRAVHGFGMKSMRQTAEKYGGSLSVQVEDHVFVLCVVLPVQPPRQEGAADFAVS